MTLPTDKQVTQMTAERKEIQFQTEGETFTVCIFPDENKGYFEHNELGDNCGGELLFERNAEGELELIDYDGFWELPRKVIDTLRANGYIVDKEFE